MSVEAPLGQTAREHLSKLDSGSVRDGPPGAGRRLLPGWAAPSAVLAVPVLGALLCVAATRTNILAPQSVRPLSGWVTGPLGAIGFPLNTGQLVTVSVLILISYMLAVRWADRVSTRAVIAAVAVLNLVVLVAPPLFSTDMFSYQAYARMFAIYHTNPYTHGGGAIALDSIYPFLGSKWISTPSVYGPLFTMISAPLAWLSIELSAITLKLVATLCTAGTLCLIWKGAPLRKVNPSRSIALFGLNPMVVLYGAGGGHNDFLMVWLMMLGVLAVLRRHSARGGALVMAGTAVKLTGGVVLPFALLAGDEPRTRRALRGYILGALAVALVVTVASYICFGHGALRMFHTLQLVQSHGAWQSIPGVLFVLAHVSVHNWIRTTVSLLMVVAVVWLISQVWKRKLDWLEGAAWATLLVLATAWSLLPWYVVWLMPLVALCRSRRLWQAANVMTALSGALMIIGFFPNGILGL